MSRSDASPRAWRGSLVGLLTCAVLLASASAAQAGLAFKRLGGPAFHFKGAPRVWCGPWEEGVASQPSIHIELRSASRAWSLSAVQADVEAGHTIGFPSDVIFNKPHGALLFVYLRNPLVEASTNEEESSGSLTFSKQGCELGDAIEFRVHAVLGSELFGGARARVNGTFRGRVGKAPPA